MASRERDESGQLTTIEESNVIEGPKKIDIVHPQAPRGLTVIKMRQPW
jgi:hypothetical protein